MDTQSNAHMLHNVNLIWIVTDLEHLSRVQHELLMQQALLFNTYHCADIEQTVCGDNTHSEWQPFRESILMEAQQWPVSLYVDATSSAMSPAQMNDKIEEVVQLISSESARLYAHSLLIVTTRHEALFYGASVIANKKRGSQSVRPLSGDDICNARDLDLQSIIYENENENENDEKWKSWLNINIIDNNNNNSNGMAQQSTTHTLQHNTM